MFPVFIQDKEAIRKSDNPAIDGKNIAFPFWYSFINTEDESADIMDSLGLPIASGATRRFPIRLNPDFTFRLLWSKYTAYAILDDPADQKIWYEPYAGWSLEIADYQLQVGIPLTRYLDLSLSYHPDSRYGMGGQNQNDVLNGSLTPIPIRSIQGYDYGMGQLKNSYLLPRNGVIVAEITNTHDSRTLYVNGALYGLKIRM